MTNELKEKSEFFINLGKNITKDVVDIIEHEDVEESNPIGLKIGTTGKWTPETDDDYDAWMKTENMIKHIHYMQKVVDEQKDEIKHLKSSQVCLRPMDEAPLDGRMVVAYINKGEKSVRYKEYSQRCELSEALGMTKTIGWIDLSELPTEIKHRDNAPDGCSWVTTIDNKRD